MNNSDAKINIGRTSYAIAEVAAQNGESEENVRTAIEEANRVGMSAPDPAIQVRWKAISPEGGPVMREQLIAWLKAQLRDDENASKEVRVYFWGIQGCGWIVLKGSAETSCGDVLAEDGGKFR